MDWCRLHAGIILVPESNLNDCSKLVSEAHRASLLLAPPLLLRFSFMHRGSSSARRFRPSR
jgi:hypothetical protein